MEYIIILGGILLMYLYMKERKDHTATKNELAVLKRMGELSELGQKLQDDHDDYDNALSNFTEHLVPDHMLTRIGEELPNLPSRPVLETTPADKPIFFHGIASADIREGQTVDIEVQPAEGRTFVSPATPRPGLDIPLTPTDT